MWGACVGGWGGWSREQRPRRTPSAASLADTLSTAAAAAASTPALNPGWTRRSSVTSAGRTSPCCPSRATGSGACLTLDTPGLCLTQGLGSPRGLGSVDTTGSELSPAAQAAAGVLTTSKPTPPSHTTHTPHSGSTSRASTWSSWWSPSSRSATTTCSSTARRVSGSGCLGCVCGFSG